MSAGGARLCLEDKRRELVTAALPGRHALRSPLAIYHARGAQPERPVRRPRRPRVSRLSHAAPRYLATCSSDCSVKIWTISSKLEFKYDKTLSGHQRWVWDAAWSADSAYLVTGTPAAPVLALTLKCCVQRPRIMLRVCGKLGLARLCASTTGTTRHASAARSPITRQPERCPGSFPSVYHTFSGSHNV